MHSITAKKITALLPGESLSGEGIEVRKSENETTYYCSFMENGIRVRNLLGKATQGYNLSRARDAVASARAKLADPENTESYSKVVPMTFEAASDKYLRMLESINGNSIKQKRQQLRDHLIPFFKGKLLNGISTFSVEEYKASRRKAGAASGTVNSELAVLMHLYSSFVEWGFTKVCPFVCKKLKVDNRRIVRFSNQECSDLLVAAKLDADPMIWLFVLIGLNTGMRHQEILAIRYDQIDFETLRIYIPEAKAGSRSQPISPNVQNALKQAREEATDKVGWVFNGLGKTGRRDSMKSQFRRVVAQIGLPTDKYTPHVMRHTAITRLAELGTSAEKIRAISGHKSLAMVQRYTHLSDSVVDSALASASIG
jgi:integrase